MRKVPQPRKRGAQISVAVVLAAVVSTFAHSTASAFITRSQSSSGRPTSYQSAVNSELVDYDGELQDDTFRHRYGETLPTWLIDKCEDCGWKHPTHIQQRVLDTVLLDANVTDVVVQAQTGSGKTLSYLLPCLASIDASRSAVQALIVVPTRELGLQVSRVAKRLAKPQNIMVMSVLQGSQNRRQRAWAWADPPQLVIGTPDELCKIIQLGGIKRYNSIRFIVVDEVDACLLNDYGNALQSSGTPLHELLSKLLSPTYDDGKDRADDETVTSASIGPTSSRPLSKERQTIFCSATIPQYRHFLKQCVQNQWMLNTPKHVALRPGEQLLPSQLQHAYVVCASVEKKLAALRRLVKKIAASGGSKILIFAEPRRPLEEMAKVIAKDLQGLYWTESIACSSSTNSPESSSAIVSVLRFEDSLSQRAVALDAFREASGIRILVSTDLAARGLDVVDITHVVHLDLPNTDTYVHRSGRTGRLGRSGQVVSIVTPSEEFVLQKLTNQLQLDISCVGRQVSKTK